ncbi:hypothetical protein ACHAQE_009075 [Botrytis cinerea]
MATRSRITEIMQTCKEAYDEGIQLQFSHFTFCNYGSWGDDNCHAQLPKHYMNPDADIMWLVHNSEPKFPFAVALYDGRPSYRMVKVFAINHQLWRDPCPRWERNVISWTFGTFADLPYQFCEEIYVVLNDLAFDLDRGVTFVEPVDGRDEPLSSRKLTSQGHEKPNHVLFKEAERRKKNFEDFREQICKTEEGYLEHLNTYTCLEYPPIIRYVIAKPSGIPSSFTCIKDQKQKALGHKSLTPINTNLLPDHLKFLISNNDDDSCFPAENDTDVYNSDNTDEEVYEDSLEYDSHVDDRDVEGDEEEEDDKEEDDKEEDDKEDNKDENAAESEDLGSSTSLNTDSDNRNFQTLPLNRAVEALGSQYYAEYSNDGDGMGHNQMPFPDEDDEEL